LTRIWLIWYKLSKEASNILVFRVDEYFQFPLTEGIIKPEEAVFIHALQWSLPGKVF
jgi:hypothetical protein